MPMKNAGKRTRYPGVYRVDAKTYRIKAKYLDPRTGKEKWIHRLLEGVSAQEAATERKRQLDEVRTGEQGDATRIRIREFARSWLESKALQLDVATVERYGYSLDHALSSFGDIFADMLRSTDVQSWIDAETKAGYAAETIRGWYSAVRTMLRDAVAALELPRDPTLRVRIPEQTEEDEVNAFTAQELSTFLGVMRDRFPQHHALTATLAFTGLRFCHVSPLKWEDVDLANATLAIRRKQVRGVVGPVSRKKRAPRIYPIGPELVSILRWHRQQYPGLPGAWVFPSKVGELRKAPSCLQKAWATCLEEAGVERRVTVHGLRRTFTDMARRAGVDSVVAKSLTGHVTERMREHYSTVREDEQRAAVADVLKLVGNSGG